jgi:hypothetical protein
MAAIGERRNMNMTAYCFGGLLGPGLSRFLNFFWTALCRAFRKAGQIIFRPAVGFAAAFPGIGYALRRSPFINRAQGRAGPQRNLPAGHSMTFISTISHTISVVLLRTIETVKSFSCLVILTPPKSGNSIVKRAEQARPALYLLHTQQGQDGYNERQRSDKITRQGQLIASCPSWLLFFLTHPCLPPWYQDIINIPQWPIYCQAFFRNILKKTPFSGVKNIFGNSRPVMEAVWHG